MRTTSVPTSARRLVLRPGVHVLRRSASELQVGLDPRRAVVLPDRPEVRAVLDRLASPASAPDPPYDERIIDALTGSGLLMDVDVLLPLVPDPPRPGAPDAGNEARAEEPTDRAADAGTGDVAEVSTGPLPRATVSALAAEAGDGVAALLARRAGLRVDVATCGSREAVAVAARVFGLLSSAGLRPRRLPHGMVPGEPSSRRSQATPGRPGPPSRGPAPAASPSLAGMLIAVGEPPREHLDAWMRTATPHLLLRVVEGHAVVGPFVVPGETDCLRCVDAHHTDLDPAWPLLVTQYASAVARPRDDTVPEPVDTLLATLAAAWAAKELVAHAEGRIPSVASATLRLDPLLTALELQRWPRHPGCGCTWG